MALRVEQIAIESFASFFPVDLMNETVTDLFACETRKKNWHENPSKATLTPPIDKALLFRKFSRAAVAGFMNELAVSRFLASTLELNYGKRQIYGLIAIKIK